MLRKSLILIGFLLTFGLWCSLGVKLYKNTRETANTTAIVRLHDVITGRFFCSGTVISDKYLITAAHCVGPREIMPGFYSPGAVSVLIKSQTNKTEIASVAGIDSVMDQAILQGNFKGWSQAGLETKTEAVVQAMGKHQLLSCGYPLSGELYCAKISEAVQYVFSFAFTGYLFPGMSGGPVFDLTTGKIVGTNFAAIDDKILIMGTQEEWASCSVKE